MTIVRRQLSLFNTAFIGTTPNKQIEKDLDHAIKLVVRHDPVGYLPGLLVAKEARIGYFAGELYVLINVKDLLEIY